MVPANIQGSNLNTSKTHKLESMKRHISKWSLKCLAVLSNQTVLEGVLHRHCKPVSDPILSFCLKKKPVNVGAVETGVVEPR